MDKTIDERAEELASVYPKKYQHFAEECYIMGATDQAEITKQEMIEKACRTYCRFCPHQCENYPHDDCQVQIELKNALEE